MTEEEIRSAVVESLGSIAPEARATEVEPDTSFRDQYEIDSIDFLNLMLALNKALDIEIPESDYPKLSSLNGCIAYLQSLIGAKEKA